MKLLNKITALSLGLSVLAGCSETNEPTIASETSSTENLATIHGMTGNVPVPLDELEWVADEYIPGFAQALIWGDPATGPSGQMYRFAANTPTPPVMHRHDNGYHAIIVSGQSKHWVEGQTEDDVPFQTAGDYFYQQGGQWHQDAFTSDQETIVYIVYEGATNAEFAEPE